ncbi:cobalt-precorrin 5A hydrolase [Clostridium tetanomorphum]|uniref:Cobalt-precorrin 5A hydrolase n=2 Tax=Clostridium tetanomorphum TaxID=1553 RepID=A0A923EC78_CLOTT|nr:cobalt-precorrin 5A hydrolase [Clostridium tetanomorphum]MBC2397760.1 cobalt-precorrin 5A hydrolase [Clostridium tetanomorphum]MBP1866038.1 cobalt-precorrin 5A hydrolase [Clostridium tetanomorphum]NRZ96486.1 cobalt-precorrin 5A hydrolase [Clostridium tetanomorphum]
MKIGVITVTHRGDEIAVILSKHFNVRIFSKMVDENFSFKDSVKFAMENCSAVVFITSTGIAVRGIAPYIKSKDKDPAVITIDNSGKFVISLLSGHLGGANELTLKISNIINATPVITTATDNIGVEAPDMVAKENNLIIDNLKDAKDIASLLVQWKKVYFHDEDEIISLPKGYSEDLQNSFGEVCVTNKLKFFEANESVKEDFKRLKLIRRNIVLGIGCRKDFPKQVMRKTVFEVLEDYNIDYRAVKSIGTVEIKKDEKAIIDLSSFLNCDLNIFSIEDIRPIQHKFEGSDFVEKTIGVRTVCEPCVELQGAKLITGKLKLNGMTLCLGKITEQRGQSTDSI